MYPFARWPDSRLYLGLSTDPQGAFHAPLKAIEMTTRGGRLNISAFGGVRLARKTHPTMLRTYHQQLTLHSDGPDFQIGHSAIMA
jgi:hypothetical protein